MLGRSLVLSLVLGAIGAAVACSSQADTAYRGTALAELHGSVQTSSVDPITTPVPALEAALLWDGQRLGTDGKSNPVYRKEVGTSVPVSGSFPASFALDIYTPPPSAALFSCYASDPSKPGQMASAQIAAILPGTASTISSETDLWGTVADFYVAYVDIDLPGDSDCPGGPLTKGYHLFRLNPTTESPDCGAAPPDDPSCRGPWPYGEVPMTTELTLVLSHTDGTATPPPPTPTPTPAP